MIDTTTYRVCQTCLMVAAGMTSYEADEDLSGGLSLLEQCQGVTVTTGDPDNDESLSGSPCEGCGSTLAGSRHEVVTLTTGGE